MWSDQKGGWFFGLRGDWKQHRQPSMALFTAEFVTNCHLQLLPWRYKLTCSLELTKNITCIQCSSWCRCLGIFLSPILILKKQDSIVDFWPWRITDLFLSPATFRATRIAREPLTSWKIAHGVFGCVAWYYVIQTFPCSSAGEGADHHRINNLWSVKPNTEKQLDWWESFNCCTGTRDVLAGSSFTSAR